MLVIGGPPVPAITNYTNCFVKAAKTAGLQVVGKQNNVKDTAATAQPIVQDLLTKNPDVNAIWCYNDPSCLGAGAVVRSSGKKAWVAGQAEGHRHHGRQRLERRRAGVKSGLITGTWDPRPNVMGTIAVRGARDAPQGGKPLSALPKIVVVPIASGTRRTSHGTSIPLKRTVKLTPIPRSWIVR